MPSRPAAASFLRAVGSNLRCEVERNPNPLTLDHVWITIQPGTHGPLVVSVNTRSLSSERAGLDSRVRRGTLRGNWKQLPTCGLEACDGFDYERLEEQTNLYYETCERAELEDFFMETCQRAMLLEVWGTPYSQPLAGLHQIHSRRASAAIARDVRGKDGALQFYFAERQSTLLVLMKFFGQP